MTWHRRTVIGVGLDGRRRVHAGQVARICRAGLLLAIAGTGCAVNPTRTPAPASTPCASPSVTFDDVPAYGTVDASLHGHVACLDRGAYTVAAYIDVGGWWTKPHSNAPLAAIAPNGTWTVDITTSDNDAYATKVAVFVVPKTYAPPVLGGGPTLPAELYDHAIAHAEVVRRAGRTISFAGHAWRVKFSPIPVGPGPNHFSDDARDVWVDGDGYLHLRIGNRGGAWYTTEVVCADTLEYGTYTLTLGTPVASLDRNAVLGFFTWDSAAPQVNYRELDIEISRWGSASADNAQYVVQPSTVEGNLHRFDISGAGTDSTHSIDWRADQVTFSSAEAHGSPLQSWTYANPAGIPPTGAGNLHINLWLNGGQPPSDDHDVEVVVKGFAFTSAAP